MPKPKAYNKILGGNSRNAVSNRRHDDDPLGPADSTYPLLGDLHCSEEQKQAAAEVIHSHIRALPPEEQEAAWEDIAGALGVDEYRPI